MNRFSINKGKFVPPFTLSNISVICRRRGLCTQASKQASSIFGLFKQASKHRTPYQASKREDLKHGACLLVDTTDRRASELLWYQECSGTKSASA
jgi:hypothetical protein